jgi:hypothetical protein
MELIWNYRWACKTCSRRFVGDFLIPVLDAVVVSWDHARLMKCLGIIFFEIDSHVHELSAGGDSSGFSSSSLPIILLALDVKVSLFPLVDGEGSDSSVLSLREWSDILIW